MNNKSTQLSLSDAITEQPKSYESITEYRAVVPIESKIRMENNCNNCNCCVFNFNKNLERI